MSLLWKGLGRLCSCFQCMTGLRAKYHPSLIPREHFSDEPHESQSMSELPMDVPWVNVPCLSQNNYSLQVICPAWVGRRVTCLPVSYWIQVMLLLKYFYAEDILLASKKSCEEMSLNEPCQKPNLILPIYPYVFTPMCTLIKYMRPMRQRKILSR